MDAHGMASGVKDTEKPIRSASRSSRRALAAERDLSRQSQARCGARRPALPRPTNAPSTPRPSGPQRLLRLRILAVRDARLRSVPSAPHLADLAAGRRQSRFTSVPRAFRLPGRGGVRRRVRARTSRPVRRRGGASAHNSRRGAWRGGTFDGIGDRPRGAHARGAPVSIRTCRRGGHWSGAHRRARARPSLTRGLRRPRPRPSGSRDGCASAAGGGGAGKLRPMRSPFPRRPARSMRKFAGGLWRRLPARPRPLLRLPFSLDSYPSGAARRVVGRGVGSPVSLLRGGRSRRGDEPRAHDDLRRRSLPRVAIHRRRASRSEPSARLPAGGDGDARGHRGALTSP